MRHYETTCVLRPNLGEAGFTEVIERCTGTVTGTFGGTVIALERIGLRKLAYMIKKESQGYYFYLNYAAPAEAVAEIERVFRIDDGVLRYLTVKLADSIDEAGMEAERQRLEKVRAARIALIHVYVILQKIYRNGNDHRCGKYEFIFIKCFQKH